MILLYSLYQEDYLVHSIGKKECSANITQISIFLLPHELAYSKWRKRGVERKLSDALNC